MSQADAPILGQISVWKDPLYTSFRHSLFIASEIHPKPVGIYIYPYGIYLIPSS